MKWIIYGQLLLAFTATYFLSAHAGLSIAVYYGEVTPLWPPSGLAIAVFWLKGWRWWPMIFIGESLIALSLGQSLVSGLSGGIIQLIEASLAIFFIRTLKLSPTLTSYRDTLWFFGTIALLSPAISGTLGASNLLLQQEIANQQFLQTALTWWLGDTLGIITITPLITCWWTQRPPLKLFFERWLLTTLIMGALFIGLFQLIPQHSSLLFFLLLPYVIYSAITLGNQGATLSLATLTCLVLSEAAFNPNTDFMLAIKMAFIGTCSLSGFLMAALIGEKSQNSRTLSEEKHKFETAFESISDGVVATNIKGKVVFLNAAAEKITGWPNKAAQGCDLIEVCPLFEQKDGKTAHPVTLFLSRSAQEDHYIYRFPNQNSEMRVIEARIKSWQQHEQIAGTVIVLRDITNENILKEELSHQANHDEITGLANRRAFIQVLKETLHDISTKAKTQTDIQRYALLYIDLDQFKLINDTCGHEIGDIMLMEIANLIRKRASDLGIAARLSGDEFGLIIPIDNEPHALAAAEAIRRDILNFRFNYQDLVFTVGASIGLTFIQPEDHSTNAILSRADIACYQAKETGRNKISTYHAEDVDMLRYQSELEWISQLKQALMQDKFLLYRQGIHAITSEEPLNHYEILIRLRQDGQIISPGSFLPIAERFGFMPVIDRWVTEKLFQHLNQNPEDKAIYNINLCGNSLNDRNFFADVKALSEREKIDNQQICFEVTERVALQDIDDICQSMHDMIKLGFKFALDDFGSGVANHAYLEKLPIEYVKIDGQFVRSLHEDKTSQIIVDSLAKIAHLKNIKCIAEWVENDEVIETLKNIGIHYAQGFWLDKPGPLRGEKIPYKHELNQQHSQAK
ncbi:MAG: EAL domain-containing protein [Pseudomonadales bacterium]|nr:EAL domain-containing protein [Pseudomonadales bacterium]